MKEIKELKEIQLIELDILKFVDKICSEHNIEYSLCGGTALGAIRHKGFIPWDDDIDIMMTRENYNKFIKVMQEQKDSRYTCILYPEIFYTFTKICDTNTMLEEINYERHKDLGVYIDVFAIDNMDEKTVHKNIKKIYRNQLLAMFAASKKFVKSNHGPAVTFVKWLIWAYAKMRGWKHFVKKAIKISTKYNNKDCKLAGIYDEFLDKEIFSKEVFEKYILVEFEDAKFPIIEQYDKYLTQVYGDYMTPPPKDKQVSHHNFIAYYKDK